MTTLFDTFMGLGRWISPFGILMLLAGVIAIGVLLIFRWSSNPAVLIRRKNRTIAGLMEFHLFRADPWIALRAFPRLLLAQAIYLRSILMPFLLSLIPISWILIQAQYWVLYQPAKPTTEVICKITLNLPPGQMLETPFQLQIDAGSPLDSSVRIPEEQTIYWSVPVPSSTRDGQIVLRGADQVWQFPLALNPFWRPIVNRWTLQNKTGWLTNPRGAVLSPTGSLSSVELRYPERSWRLAGIDWNGGGLLIAASFLLAWVLKKPMKVNL